MTSLIPRIESLPEEQRKLWPLLTPVAEKGFVLYGGTAIALHLGHRISVDFDFFTSNSFENKEILKGFPFLANYDILQYEKNTLSILTNGVKISFFGEISFGRVGNPSITTDNSLQVASLDDLMATKLKALFDRVSYKDYFDISTMIQHGVSLAKGLASAEQMFGIDFAPAIALKTLTYFHGGSVEELGEQDRKVLRDAVQQVNNLPQSRIVSTELSVHSTKKINVRKR